MSTIETHDPTTRPPLGGRRGLLVAVAALAAVFVAVAAGLILQPGADEIAAPTTEAPVAAPVVDEAQPLAIVEAYEAAEDIDSALALVAEDLNAPEFSDAVNDAVIPALTRRERDVVSALRVL